MRESASPCVLGSDEADRGPRAARRRVVGVTCCTAPRPTTIGYDAPYAIEHSTQTPMASDRNATQR